MNDQPASYKEYKKTTENPSSEGYAKYLEKMQTLKKKKKGKQKDLPGNLNKSEMTLLKKLMVELKDTSAKNPHKKETLRDKIRDLKANNPQKKLNRGNFSGNPQGSGDRDGPFWNQKNKGGIVKKYKGGLMVKPKAAKRGY